MEFVLIRHTRCDIAPGICYGRLDVPLAKSAPEDIGHTLARTPSVDLVVSSPAQRCHRLAIALGQRDGCDVRVLSELQELDFGTWEGMNWTEIPRPLSDEWAADP
jgi:alpha-ribazole phosphatase